LLAFYQYGEYGAFCGGINGGNGFFINSSQTFVGNSSHAGENLL
jgi:hypothetical protein